MQAPQVPRKDEFDPQSTRGWDLGCGILLCRMLEFGLWVLESKDWRFREFGRS